MTKEKLTEIETRANAATPEQIAIANASVPELCAALRQAWKERGEAIHERECDHKCWDDFVAILQSVFPALQNRPLFQQADMICGRITELERRVTTLQVELDAKAFELSPEMVQALQTIRDLAGWCTDDAADPENKDPEDMVQHTNGLIRQECMKVLKGLE